METLRSDRLRTRGGSRRIVIALFAAVALLLAACDGGGSGGGDGGSGGTGGGTTPTTPGGDGGGGDDGGDLADDQHLEIGMGAIIRNFDPASTQGVNDYVKIRMVYDTLVTLDSGQPEPWAAESWDAVSPTQWRFHIREGIEFANGEPFDAEAVRYTFQRALDSDANPWRVRIDALESMDIEDDHTIVFNLSYPVGNWPARVGIVWIVPPVYSESNDISVAPLGSGPFQVTSFTSGEEVRFEANPDYWRGAPTLQTITMRAIPENATRVASLLAGDIDVAYRILPDQVPQVEGAGYEVLSVPSGFLANLFFQSWKEPVDDVRVRQAIDYAIDKEAIREGIGGGFAGDVQGQAVGPISIGFDSSLQPRPYDPDRARALLAEAGYPNGFELGFDYSLGRYFADREVAEAVIGYLSAVGIQIVPNAMEGGAWLDAVYTGDWGPLNFWSYQDAPFYDISITTEIIRADGFRKITDDTRIDQYLDDAFEITDPAEREAHLQEYGEYLIENAYLIPLYHDPGLYAASPRVRDLEILPSTLLNLWDTYVVEE